MNLLTKAGFRSRCLGLPQLFPHTGPELHQLLVQYYDRGGDPNQLSLPTVEEDQEAVQNRPLCHLPEKRSAN